MKNYENGTDNALLDCMENLDEKEKKNIYYIIDKRSEYKNVEKYTG